MCSSFTVSITGVKLPHLSRSRTFDATFKVARPEPGDFGYGAIMRIGMMDDLGIDQSQTNKIITWGNDIEVPMVPLGYWTDSRISTICNIANSQSNEGIEKNNEEIGTNKKLDTGQLTTTSLFSTTNNNQLASFSKAVYKKPDLLEVAKRDGGNLTPAQQAALLNVLTANNQVFLGGLGHYTGPPVGLTLKDDTKPWRAKPHPIPLKNRKIMEHELLRQCSIGMLQHIATKEFEGQVWAFPAFGIPKKDGSI